MDTTEQHFLKKQTRHLGVVFLLDVGNSRENAMRLRGKPDVRGFERFTHNTTDQNTAIEVGATRSAREELGRGLGGVMRPRAVGNIA